VLLACRLRVRDPYTVRQFRNRFLARLTRRIQNRSGYLRSRHIHSMPHESRYVSTSQHFHFLRANALRVGLPFASFIGPFTPLMRAQKLLRRAASLLPGFTLPVTAILSLLPGFAFLYDATPFLFNPPVALFPSLRVHAGVLAI
jgi:hypothetical protein